MPSRGGGEGVQLAQYGWPPKPTTSSLEIGNYHHSHDEIQLAPSPYIQSAYTVDERAPVMTRCVIIRPSRRAPTTPWKLERCDG
jgi:hypothetical protein